VNPETQIVFQGFRLDTQNRQLYKGAEKILLRPKSYAVLHYLAAHPHRLATRDELMSAVWPRARVVDAALRVSIQEIRKALGGSATHPKFIETVGKRGYRFIAPVSLQFQQAGDDFTTFVGREAELNDLQHHLGLANTGKRQMVFVTGEPGIGKTTLVETFTSRLPANDGALVGHGQCIEQYGSSEAYLPVLDLLERLCALPGREDMLECLRRNAPSWLISLPAIVGASERAELLRQAAGTTPERRLREITAFLESIAKERTVVLVLEDLHWIDPSTLAFLSYLARRREPARLLVIGTYRENEVERSDHPLKTVKAELQLHKLCAHLRLKLLAKSAVGEYLGARFESMHISPDFLQTVYRRSEGNPLFMVNVTDYLAGREFIVRHNDRLSLIESGERDRVPETLRDLIERQVDALPQADRELLEIASVAGTTFSVAVIARALGQAREKTETLYRDLAKASEYLQYAGLRKRPNGRGTPRYSFVHALYQNVIYDRLTAERRRQLHQAIGERTEAAYTGAPQRVAAELAVHFERAGDLERALKYLLQAAQNSIDLSAYSETIDYASKGLDLAESMPATTQRRELELNLQLLTAVAVCASKGYAANETQDAFLRARELSRKTSNDALAFQSLAGIWSFYLLRGEARSALGRAQELLALARQTRQPGFLLNAHMAMALSLFYQGKFQSAHGHIEQALPLYDFEYHRSTLSLFGWDPGVLVYCYDAQALWFLGFPERAEQAAEQAITLARKLASPFNEALCYAIHATYYTYRRDATAALAMAEAALKISHEHGFLHWSALGSLNKGWSMSRLGNVREGLPYLLEGLQKWASMGAQMALPTYLLLLGEVYQKEGKVQQALAAVEDGLAISARNNDCHYDAELYRLKGELLLKNSKENSSRNFTEVEGCFRMAIDIARRQKARSLELRAATALARLWRSTDKSRDADQMLNRIYRRFSEGFDTPDLKQAKALLDELK
jgi:DNA-binding winged helix-turn-helix (wHTH) protein